MYTKDDENISKLYKTIYEDAGKGYINSLKLNGISISTNNDSKASKFVLNEKNTLVEAIEMEFDKKGGIIVFSTDVNAVYEDQKGFLNKLKSWTTAKIQSLKNRMFKNSKLSNVANKFDEVYGFSIGNFFKGRYKSSGGKTYDETSTSIEIIGIESSTLLAIAEEVAREFQQQTVLVKDYQSGNIYLANAKKS
jgi:hypothetical protein